MSHARKTIPALRRTYITSKVGKYGFHYKTRMIDIRSGKDIKRHDEDLPTALFELNRSVLPEEPEKEQFPLPKRSKKAQINRRQN
jgi:hypothetical protein